MVLLYGIVLVLKIIICCTAATCVGKIPQSKHLHASCTNGAAHYLRSQWIMKGWASVDHYLWLASLPSVLWHCCIGTRSASKLQKPASDSRICWKNFRMLYNISTTHPTTPHITAYNKIDTHPPLGCYIISARSHTPEPVPTWSNSGKKRPIETSCTGWY